MSGIKTAIYDELWLLSDQLAAYPEQAPSHSKLPEMTIQMPCGQITPFIGC